MEGKVSFGLFFLTLMGAITGSAGAEWGYSDNGAAKWGDHYPICKNKKQSPINIEPCKASHDNKLGAFTFTNFDKAPVNASFEISNNGHTFAVAVSSINASISGGGLSGSFNTDQFHFHWGKDNDGSEHEVDGEQDGGELHIVHHSSKYVNLSVAANKPGGLAVLGIFLKVGSENSYFNNFLKYAANVTKADSTVQADAISLDKLLPTDPSSFYRYDGSLTTPPCYESVTWTVFKNPVEISQAQLNQLRSLKKNNGTAIEYNFRPVQPLNGRVVKASFQAAAACPTTSPTQTTPSLATRVQSFAGVLTVFFGVLALVSF